MAEEEEVVVTRRPRRLRTSFPPPRPRTSLPIIESSLTCHQTAAFTVLRNKLALLRLQQSMYLGTESRQAEKEGPSLHIRESASARREAAELS